jgi:hypothetical protein
MPVSKSNAMCYPKNKYHAPVQSISPLIPSLDQLTSFNEHVSYLSPSNPFHPPSSTTAHPLLPRTDALQ